MREEERRAALARQARMEALIGAVKRFARDFEQLDTPGGSLIQTDGSITAELPLWEMTGETRETWMERVRAFLTQGDYGIVLIDAGMRDDGHRYFRASFALAPQPMMLATSRVSEQQQPDLDRCVINNPYCTPRPCATCRRVFCAHEREDRRAFGSYGQYCSPECRDAKCKQVWERGSARFEASRVVLVVEQEYCYLVCNRHKVGGEKPGYGFKILQESAETPEGKLELDYCHYPGFSVEDHPVTYMLHPCLSVGIAVYDERDHSMWTIVGFRLLPDGQIDTYGVGGQIEVIDLRAGPTQDC